MTEPTTSHNEIETTYAETSQTLDALIRAGAQRMLMAALEAEVEAYIQQHAHLRDENSHALVVRNGKARKRTLYCGAGTLSIRTPRVQDKVPGQHFTSAILPPYLRRAPQLESALPVLYTSASSVQALVGVLDQVDGHRPPKKAPQ